MILAYHVTISCYGFWLPNDPRGSGSDYVRSTKLLAHGHGTKTISRRSVAYAEHDRTKRLEAKRSLAFPVVKLTCRQALAVGRGFDHARRESAYVIHACSILPSHAHLVIGRHERDIGRIIGHLKTRARQRLTVEKLWSDERPLWAHRAWKVFLDSEKAVLRAIRYVEQNPLKEGKPVQRWSLVTPWTL